MARKQLEMLLGILKLLADESRMKMLGLLAQQEYSVKALAELADLKEPTVSHHLGKLQEHGLVSMRADGTTHFYRLNRVVLHRFRKDLFSTSQVTALVEEVNEDAYERKVFRTYLDGERITQIPTMRKKREVLLRWLAGYFEEGKEYSHKQVNAVIKKHHSDTATLRREMIGIRLLERKRDTYRKLPA